MHQLHKFLQYLITVGIINFLFFINQLLYEFQAELFERISVQQFITAHYLVNADVPKPNKPLKYMSHLVFPSIFMPSILAISYSIF